MHVLKRTLERFGLKQTQLAKLLEVSPRTVSLWATGEVALPGPVRAYLRLLQSASAESVASELARLEGSRKTFDDGLYHLSYEGRFEPADPGGEALAVLRAGRIIGCDRWGGMFEGTYRFDHFSQTNQFHMCLKVPPEGELVTGLKGGPDGSSVEFVVALERATPVASATIEIESRAVDLKLTYLGPLPN